MTLEYVVYRLPRDQREAYEAASVRAGAALTASPECQGFELSHCVEDPDLYVWRIQWQSIDAHLQGFRQSGHFEEYFEAMRPYFPFVEQMHHYQPMELGGK